jgi:hypothetical protein
LTGRQKLESALGIRRTVPAAQGSTLGGLMTPAQWRLAGIGAGVVVLLGSLLPWVTVSTVFGQLNVAGTDGDGVLTLGFGAAIVVGFLARWAWLQLLGALGAIIIAVYNVFNVTKTAADLDSDYVRGSVGWGLWLTLVAAVAALAVAWVANQRVKS